MNKTPPSGPARSSPRASARFGVLRWDPSGVARLSEGRLVVPIGAHGLRKLRLSRTSAEGIWRRDRPGRVVLFFERSLSSDAFAGGCLSAFGGFGAVWLLTETVRTQGQLMSFASAARTAPSVVVFATLCGLVMAFASLSAFATRTIALSRHELCLEIRLGPLLWERRVALAEIARAEVYQAAWFERSRGRPVEPLRRFSARARLRSGGTISLLVRVDQRGREEAAWLVERIEVRRREQASPRDSAA